MGVTYQQKRQILDFMSERAHWDNVFDIDFFTNEQRKWSRQRAPSEIMISSSPDRKSFVVTDEMPGGGQMELSHRESKGLTITDESSRSVTIGKQGITSHARNEGSGPVAISAIASSREIGIDDKDARFIAIPELAAYVRFHEDHSKSVFLADASKRISFGPPTVERDNSLHPGRFFHVISFDLDTAAKWGLTPYGMLNGTKLILSKDLSIEPDLKTFNELDPEKAAEYLNYLLRDEWDETYEGPWQWRPKKVKNVGDITHLQKQWADSTEFSGYFVDLPHQFFIETTESGFKLATSLDHRETIWAQSLLLHDISGGAVRAMNIARPDLSPGTMLHLLNNGQSMTDHRGRNWKCAVLETAQTAKIAQSARKLGRQNFGLTGYHFAAINFDENACFIAMDEEVLERISGAYSATVEMLRMAASGKHDKAHMKRLLDAGADLRLVNPQGAQAGRTLANEMKEAENYGMLADMKEYTGDIHDLSFDPAQDRPDPDGP